MTELGSELKTLTLLRALPATSRAELLQNAVVHAVTPGAVLFEQGDMLTFQYVVLAGSVHLLGRSSAGREVLIEVVEPPALIIPAAVAAGSPYLMRARVPEPSRLLLIYAGVFRSAMLREPLLAREVIASLAGQFRRLVRQVKNLQRRTGTERAGCYLLALSERQGTPHQAILPYGKTLIASELGMTREEFFARPVGAPARRCHRPGGDDHNPEHQAPCRRLRHRPADRRSGRLVKHHPMPHQRHNPGKHDRADRHRQVNELGAGDG